MSDFLTNLVSRTLQANEPVQPRIPVLFEPLRSPSFAEEATESREASPPAQGERRERVDAAQPSRTEPVHTIRMPVEPEPEVRPREPSPQIAVTERAPRVERIITEREIVREPVIIEQTTRVIDHPAPSDRPIDKANRILERVEIRHTQAPRPVVPHESIAAIPSPVVEVRNERVEHHHTAERHTVERFDKTKPSEAERPMSAPLQRETSPFIQPRLELPELPKLPEAQTPEPTIEVTIGRIEIRAAVPDSKPQVKPRTHVPALSLQDYLKQRTGNR